MSERVYREMLEAAHVDGKHLELLKQMVKPT